MSAPTATAPVLTRTGSVPATPHKLFLNLPVSDLQRSITFFEALGFAFHPGFTDETATCMLIGEDAYAMLLTHEAFTGFSGRPLGAPARETSAMMALSVASREEADAMLERAVDAGGAAARPPVDHGFMYATSFYDPDGHHWEAFWMDPAAIPPVTEHD